MIDPEKIVVGALVKDTDDAVLQVVKRTERGFEGHILLPVAKRGFARVHGIDYAGMLSEVTEEERQEALRRRSMFDENVYRYMNDGENLDREADALLRPLFKKYSALVGRSATS